MESSTTLECGFHSGNNPMQEASFTIQATLWLYPSEKASWHFISIPKDISERIRSIKRPVKRGWGSVPVLATAGKTHWKTSLFPDARSGAYIMPVKLSVRHALGLYKGDVLRCTLTPEQQQTFDTQ